MSIINDITSKLTNVGKDGLNRARDAKDTTKVSMDIKNREIQLQKYYRDLGKEYYQDHKDDTALAYPLMEQIRNELAAIASLQAEKDRLRGIRRCPNCGEVTNANAKFCPACGTQVQKPVAAEIVEEADIPKPETDKETAVDAEYCEVGETVKETLQEAAEQVAEAVEGTAEMVKEAVEEAAKKLDE